jgi:hypothetical protein
MPEIDDLIQWRVQQILLSVVARLAHRSTPEVENSFRGIMLPSESWIPNRKKTELITGFPAKSITSSTPKDKATQCPNKTSQMSTLRS